MRGRVSQTILRLLENQAQKPRRSRHRRSDWKPGDEALSVHAPGGGMAIVRLRTVGHDGYTGDVLGFLSGWYKPAWWPIDKAAPILFDRDELVPGDIPPPVRLEEDWLEPVPRRYRRVVADYDRTHAW